MTMRRVFCFAFLALLFGAQRTNAQLLAHAELNQSGSVFSYTLFNDEPSSGPNFLSTFNLTVNAPITVTGIPAGWDFVTDNSTYVDWFNTDSTLPYPHDVAPGTSLWGFTVESTVDTTVTLDYNVTSWDHAADSYGPVTQSFILAPSGVPTSVPEASSLTVTFAAGVAACAFCLLRRKRT